MEGEHGEKAEHEAGGQHGEEGEHIPAVISK